MAIYLWSWGRIILFRCTRAQCVILIKQVFNIKKFQDHPDTLKNQTKSSEVSSKCTSQVRRGELRQTETVRHHRHHQVEPGTS